MAQVRKKIATELVEKGIETFLPLEAAMHQRSDRRRIVQLPLFPNYIFVRISEALDRRIPVLHTNWVICRVGSRGIGIPIPESEIQSVRTLLQGGITYQVRPFLAVGERARIRGGSLDNVEGILVRENEDFSLVISINIIQRSLAVRLAGYQVEAA